MVTVTIKKRLDSADKDDPPLTYDVVQYGEKRARSLSSGKRRGAPFNVIQGGGIAFKCDYPFTVFFRYGSPDKGHIDDWDRDKQIRGKLQTSGLNKRKYVTSVKASRQDIYAPMIVVYIDGDFVHDNALSFEVSGTS